MNWVNETARRNEDHLKFRDLVRLILEIWRYFLRMWSGLLTSDFSQKCITYSTHTRNLGQTHWGRDEMAASMAPRPQKCVSIGTIHIKSLLVYIMVWHRTGHRPISEPMMFIGACMRHSASEELRHYMIRPFVKYQIKTRPVLHRILVLMAIM